MVSSINKNRFKKTYGYERVTPALANVLIAGTTESILIDRNIKFFGLFNGRFRV